MYKTYSHQAQQIVIKQQQQQAGSKKQLQEIIPTCQNPQSNQSIQTQRNFKNIIRNYYEYYQSNYSRQNHDASPIHKMKQYIYEYYYEINNRGKNTQNKNTYQKKSPQKEYKKSYSQHNMHSEQQQQRQSQYQQYKQNTYENYEQVLEKNKKLFSRNNLDGSNHPENNNSSTSPYIITNHQDQKKQDLQRSIEPQRYTEIQVNNTNSSINTIQTTVNQYLATNESSYNDSQLYNRTKLYNQSKERNHSEIIQQKLKISNGDHSQNGNSTKFKLGDYSIKMIKSAHKNQESTREQSESDGITNRNQTFTEETYKLQQQEIHTPRINIKQNQIKKLSSSTYNDNNNKQLQQQQDMPKKQQIAKSPYPGISTKQKKFFTGKQQSEMLPSEVQQHNNSDIQAFNPNNNVKHHHQQSLIQQQSTLSNKEFKPIYNYTKQQRKVKIDLQKYINNGNSSSSSTNNNINKITKDIRSISQNNHSFDLSNNINMSQNMGFAQSQQPQHQSIQNSVSLQQGGIKQNILHQSVQNYQNKSIQQKQQQQQLQQQNSVQNVHKNNPQPQQKQLYDQNSNIVYQSVQHQQHFSSQPVMVNKQQVGNQYTISGGNGSNNYSFMQDQYNNSYVVNRTQIDLHK